MLQAIVLALVQGLTEFLPISSTAHLVLVPWLFGWQDPGLTFDIALHLGTLTAVIGYFRRDLITIIRDSLQVFRTGPGGLSTEGRMGWYVVLATIPVGAVGLAVHDWVETAARNPQLIAAMSILFGAVLWVADRWGRKARPAEGMGLRDAMLIGLAQAVALIPGVSRSGITMTAGLAVGLTREGSARFAFLLSIPVIVLAGLLETVKMVEAGLNGVSPVALVVAFVVSAVSAYLCIKYLLLYLQRHSMNLFVAYRILLGLALLGLMR